MALGFSSGLLSGLQNYGQGGDMPSDPRDRNLLQKAGVTNPLLQQFGQGFGNVMGIDTRSAADQFRAAAANADVNTPEGRKQYLQALSQYDPQKAVEQAMAFKKADQDAEVAKLQKEKYQQDLANGKIKTFTRTVKKPVKTVLPSGEVITSEQEVATQYSAYNYGTTEKPNWMAVDIDEDTGAIVPKRKLKEEEIADLETSMQGTSIRIGGKGKPVNAIIVEGGYEYEKDGKTVFIPEEFATDLNKVEKPEDKLPQPPKKKTAYPSVQINVPKIGSERQQQIEGMLSSNDFIGGA